MPRSWKPTGKWFGARLDTSSDEPTLVGAEVADEIADARLFDVREREQEQTCRMQTEALRGLWVLLVMTFVLGAAVLAGVASDLVSAEFGLALLGLTISPSVGAWVLVVRWAFRSEAPPAAT